MESSGDTGTRSRGMTESPAGRRNGYRPRLVPYATCRHDRHTAPTMQEASLPPTLRWTYRLENPFFLRDARAHSRRKGWGIGGTLLRQVLFLFVPLLIAENAVPWLPLSIWEREVLTIFVLGTCHSLNCAVAGSHAGFTVLRDEYRQGTLDSLRLLPTPAPLWLLRKLLFPLFALLVVWAAALPFYAMLAVRGHFLPEQLLPGAVSSLALGLFTFAAAIATPPEGTTALAADGPGRATRWSLAGRQALYGWLGLCLCRVGWEWVFWIARLRAAPWKSATPFFGAWISPAQFLIPQLLTFSVAAVLTAISAAGRDSALWHRAARTARQVAGLAAYTFLVGALPASLPLPARWVLLALLPVAALAINRSARRAVAPPEDRLSAGEVRWCGSLWDNALLVRDLRAALRWQSLRRDTLRRCAQLLLCCLALAGISFLPAVTALTGQLYGRQSPVLALLLRTAVHLAFLAPLTVFLAGIALGGKAREYWLRESQVGTLPQLLTTPLEAGALVRGRWGASMLTGASYAAPALLGTLTGVAVLLLAHPRAMLPYLALILLMGSCGVLLAAAVSRPGENHAQLSPGAAAGLMGGLLVATVELTAMIYLCARLMENVAAGGGEIEPGLCVVALLITALNVGLTGGCYRGAVAEIGRMRTADIG